MPKSIRGSRVLSTLCVLAFLGLLLPACSDGESTAQRDPATRSETPEAAAPAPAAETNAAAERSPAARTTGKPPAEKAPRNPNERPIPAFEGTTLAGTQLSVRDLLGTRLLLYFFNPEVDNAEPVSRAVDALAEQASDNNFQVVGVGVGSDSSTLSRFAQKLALKYPVIDDSAGAITRLFRLRAPMAAIGIDADGYMTFGIGAFPSEGEIQDAVESDLRERLRVPEPDTAHAGALFAYPAAPELGVVGMSTGEVLETADLRGRAAIVIFFLHTCPHCHKALESIKTTLAKLPADQQPKLVAISIQNAPSAVRPAMKELGLDFFDPYLDPGNHAVDRWGVTGGVPVVTVLDAEGRIRHRSTGWNEKRDPGILRMKIAQAAGASVPMLLDPKGYSGNDVCGTCHEQEYATWQYTSHASAFDTLVKHGADRRTDCVGCHVVGFEERGGYDFVRQPPHLEDVGCESCHGRGGPHLSPDFVPTRSEGTKTGPDYAQVCATCHNPTHSLGFDYATFHPRISHTRIASLSNSERAELVEGGGPSRDLLPSQAELVGSDACQSCHSAEFETWQKSPHGHAVASLEAEGKAGEAECLQCHTTAYGRPGGFPSGAPVADHPDLARVGCESCHGPGGDHIGENAKRVGTIISLGDKCDSCVILKICGSCHDDANDPGFEFKVEERIDAQRHGTIDSAATRAGESASHLHPARAVQLDDHALLQQVFEQLALVEEAG